MSEKDTISRFKEQYELAGAASAKGDFDGFLDHARKAADIAKDEFTRSGSVKALNAWINTESVINTIAEAHDNGDAPEDVFTNYSAAGVVA